MVLALRQAARLAGALLLVRLSTLCGLPDSTVGPAVEGAAWATESDVLAHLKDSPPEESVAILRLCVSKSWWAAARELISLGHARGAPATALHQEVRKLLSEVKRSADDFAAFADETYRSQTKGLTEVHCAVQWAQNSTTIFLGVKYAARWSAPGAIEVVDVKVNITEASFMLEGFGHHSDIRKRYVVSLPFYEGLVPESSRWSAASVGRLTATLQKGKEGSWPRLLKSKDKTGSKSPITKWLDMQERWDEELNGLGKSPKETVKTKKDEKKKAVAKKPLPQWRKKLRRWWRKFDGLVMHRGSSVLMGLLGVVVLLFLQLLRLPQRSTVSAEVVRKHVAEAAQARSSASSDLASKASTPDGSDSVGTDGSAAPRDEAKETPNQADEIVT